MFDVPAALRPRRAAALGVLVRVADPKPAPDTEAGDR